jgi:hypothetical protein
MKYTVTGKSVLITGGVLTLSAAQAGDRSHALKKLEAKGKFEITHPVTFKNGEQFGYEGDLPKALVSDLQSEKQSKSDKEKEAAEKAEKEAAEKAEKEAAEKAEKEANKGNKQ